MMAARFRSVKWVGIALVPALCCYLVTQRVAAERAELAKVERRIGDTRRAIRDLETELGTRGSMAQIERWNTQTLALSAPTARQFISGDVQLAGLTALPTPARPVAPTAATPAGVTGAVRQAAATPAATASAVIVDVREVAFRPAPKPSAAASAGIRRAAAKTPEVETPAEPLLRQATYQKPQRDAVKPRPTKVAMLSDGPLDAGTLADIGRLAKSERGSRKR